MPNLYEALKSTYELNPELSSDDICHDYEQKIIFDAGISSYRTQFESVEDFDELELF